jgi:hypothetical protein
MIDYAITSNVIRSMWEIESESLYLRGNIDASIIIYIIIYL